MSLMDRVAASAGGTVQEAPQNEEMLERLRNRVRTILPAEAIVSGADVNPRQAKSEIRSACRRVFEEDNSFSGAGVSTEALVDALIDSLFGFGPLEGLLADDTVTEVMVNGSKSVFYERDGKLYRSAQVFADDEQVRALIDKIIGPLGRRIDEASPMVNARLPQGHRVNAIIPPLAMDGPTLTIRKFRNTTFGLAEMRRMGSFDEAVHAFLSWAVRARKNIAVSGGTGSGKTTLLNALSYEIPETERIITIEDSAELKFDVHPHVVRLEARPRNMEGTGQVTIRDLVINALRMRPDRIVVGEVRNAEALDMLQAMNTGHDGSLTTLHANTAFDAITRLTTMVRYAVDLPVDVIEAQIASALDVIVQTARAADGGRYISDIVECVYDRQTKSCTVVPVFSDDRLVGEKKWLSVPSWVQQLPARGVADGKEVEQWQQRISCAV